MFFSHDRKRFVCSILVMGELEEESLLIGNLLIPDCDWAGDNLLSNGGNLARKASS